MSAGLHRLVLVLAWLGLAFPATAQQYPNWLQVLYNHQSVNPAYTAIGENLGFFIMNRSQLTGIHPANYARQLSFHSPVFNQFNGAGLDLISDRTDSISHLTLFTNYSYEMLIDDDIRLRLGEPLALQESTKPAKWREISWEISALGPLCTVPTASSAFPSPA